MSAFGNSSEWPLVPLKDIAPLKRGYDLPVSRREEGNIPIYAANGKNGTHGEAKIVGPGVITGRSGTIGKVHYSEGDYWPLNTSLYVTNFRGNDPRWVFYMLKAFRLERFSEGAGVPTLNRNLIHDELIPLPPLAEQKRIAAILDKADAIRRKRQQAIQLADDFLRAVFLDMFGDPVTNPKGWEVRPIDELCTDIVDCVNRTAPVVDYSTPYKMIRTTNVRNYALDISNVRYVDEETYKKWTRRLKPQIDDIVFTREAPAGEAAVVHTYENIFLGQRTMHFRPDQERMSSEYLMFELMGGGVKRQINRMHAGSTVTHLSVPECKKFQIRVPPLELQKKFDAIRKAILRSSALSCEAVEVPLFESISQKAFRGEL